MSLPRDANRDQAFAVDIVYAQTNNGSSLFCGPNAVGAGARTFRTPTPSGSFRSASPALESFDGNMTVARGTTYDLRDAWQGFIQFYGNLIEHNFGMLLFGIVVVLVLVLVVAAVRRGAKGLLTVLFVLAIVAILAAMMLPALSLGKPRLSASAPSTVSSKSALPPAPGP